jgi:hypothetical protein
MIFCGSKTAFDLVLDAERGQRGNLGRDWRDGVREEVK